MKKLGSIIKLAIYVCVLFGAAKFCNAQSLACENKSLSCKAFIEIPLNDVYYYSYDIKQKDSSNYIRTIINDNSPESIIANKYSNELLLHYKIKLVRKISFKQNNKEYTVIKYIVIDNSNVQFKHTIQLLKNESNNYRILSNDENAEVVNVLSSLNRIGFWNFYSKEDDPSFPEINKLKKSVKTSDGCIDIRKLSSAINENKAELAKYLD